MKNIFLFSVLLLSLCACQSTPQFNDKMKQKIEDAVKRDDITGRMHMFFRGIDNENWQEVEEVLLSEVEIDNGTGPIKKSAKELIASWKEAFRSFKTHHLVSNYGIVVTEKNAKLMFVATRTQVRQGQGKSLSKTSHGFYEVSMVQPEGDATNWAWNIASIKYKNQFTIDKR